jgi:cytidylate kinase
VNERRLVIALDGPSGAGKSTAGRALAERLGYTFIDTGAMYRALALKALRAGVAPDDGEALAALLARTAIALSDAGRKVGLDGEDVSAAIRTREVSDAASRVAAHGAVRRAMVARQQEMGRTGGVVMDGRDIGTAVFPGADVKFFVLADPARRAERRHRELQAAGQPADLKAIEQDVRERDQRDSTRAESPLVRAADAVDVDTTDLDPDQVVEAMLAVVRSRTLAPAR